MVRVESWVRKSDIDRPDDLFGEGKGFIIGKSCPKVFNVGFREDLVGEILSQQGSTFTLYLYEMDVSKAFFKSLKPSEMAQLESFKLPPSYTSLHLQIEDD